MGKGDLSRYKTSKISLLGKYGSYYYETMTNLDLNYSGAAGDLSQYPMVSLFKPKIICPISESNKSNMRADNQQRCKDHQ